MTNTPTTPVNQGRVNPKIPAAHPKISLRVFFGIQKAEKGFRFVNEFVPRETFWTLDHTTADEAIVTLTRQGKTLSSQLKLDLNGMWRKYAEKSRSYRWIIANGTTSELKLSDKFYDSVATANEDLAASGFIAAAPVPGLFQDTDL